MAYFKDFFLIISGFALLQILYFFQSDGLMVKIYFFQPLVIHALSLCCYVLFLLKGRAIESEAGFFLGENHRVKEDPKK
jgi:uncharacterized membrane protein